MKAFTYFGMDFDVQKGYKMYKIIHVESGWHGYWVKTLKSIIPTLELAGEAKVRQEIAEYLERKAEDWRRRKARDFDTILEERLKAEKVHYTHRCSVAMIKHYAVKLNNGKTLYPTQEDVYQRVIKPNLAALKNLKSLGRKLSLL